MLFPWLAFVGLSIWSAPATPVYREPPGCFLRFTAYRTKSGGVVTTGCLTVSGRGLHWADGASQVDRLGLWSRLRL